MSLLGRAGRRYHLRHPGQLALAVAGVAVGVAVAVAIDLANESARRSFRLATVATAGAATHEIRAASGPLESALWTRLRVEHGVGPLAPVVEGGVRVALPPERSLRVLGIDPWSEAPFRGFLAGAARATSTRRNAGVASELGRFLTEPGAALLTAETAARWGLVPGDRDELPIRVGERRERLRVVGLLSAADDATRDALADVAIVDIATAQELLGMRGRLSRLELVLPEDDAALSAAEARIAALLPPGTMLARPEARTETLEQMTRAFRFNLRALSLLALLCGSFLIYNALTFSVVQRRDLFGRLRAVGVRRREIVATVLLEAAAIGAAGSAIGVALGVVLGRGLTALVLTTIRDLYFSAAAEGFALPATALARGLLLGLVAALAAAAVPAYEAAASPPRTTLLRSELERRVRRLAGRGALAGLALAGAGAALFALAPRSLPLSIAAFFLVVVGAAFVVPWALARVMAAAARLVSGRGAGWYLRTAARAVGASLSRTGVAVAALALAVSVSIAVAVMIGSFREAVRVWLDRALTGDLYVSPPARPQEAIRLRLADEVVAAIARIPDVERMNTLRTISIERPGELPVRVVGVDLDARARGSYAFVAGEPDAAWRALAERDDAVLVTEPFAARRGLRLGDRLELAATAGTLRFEIVGIDTDYGSDQGVVTLTDRAFRRHFGDTEVAVLSLRAKAGVDVDALARAVEAAAPPGALSVQRTAAIKALSAEVFDRTFAITGVLRWLAIVVAVLGILAALAAYELDRGRELALLRALGLTRRQLVALVGAETAWIGFAAGLFALPLGALLAALMVHVINRRSFGWSMELLLPARPFAEALALAVVAALAAGAVPALRLARADPATALRDE